MCSGHPRWAQSLPLWKSPEPDGCILSTVVEIYLHSLEPCVCLPHPAEVLSHLRSTQELNSATLVLTCGNFLCVGPKAQLMLRYPDGKREQVSLPEQAKLLVSGVNGNTGLSRRKVKPENFCAWGGTVEIGSSGRGVSRECLPCVPCHPSLRATGSVSPLQLGFCALQCLPQSPHCSFPL